MTAAAAGPGRGPLRLLDILQKGAGYLGERGIDQPRHVAELLVSHTLGCKRLELYLRFEEMPSESAVAIMRERVRRVGGGEPLQYVLGDVEFMGHRLRCDRRALIPRPDTEALVEMVLGDAGLWGRVPCHVADVGTGSGCIAISLALARPAAQVMATDVHEAALELAAENAAAHGLRDRIRLERRDLLEGVAADSLDAVVSNLPYIRSGDCEALPRSIREHEPRSALDGGPDGLDLIRRLTGESIRVLRPGGALYLETGWDQGEAVTACLRAAGFEQVRVGKDLGGRDRVAVGRRPAGEAAGG